MSPANSTQKEIKHWVHPVDKSKKTALLTHLIKEKNWHQVLVFSRTKHGANRITKVLEATGIRPRQQFTVINHKELVHAP